MLTGSLLLCIDSRLSDYNLYSANNPVWPINSDQEKKKQGLWEIQMETW